MLVLANLIKSELQRYRFYEIKFLKMVKNKINS